jgi:hypothetical protein
MVSAAFADRPLKKLILFDVDGTLTLPRQVRYLLYQQDLGRYMLIDEVACYPADA